VIAIRRRVLIIRVTTLEHAAESILSFGKRSTDTVVINFKPFFMAKIRTGTIEKQRERERERRKMK
jgi:hypothetical protein